MVLQALLGNGFNVVGYAAPVVSELALGVPYLGNDEGLAEVIDPARCAAALGLGKTAVSSSRLSVFEQLSAAGFSFPPVIARGAVVHEDVALEEGSVVLDGAVVATGARLGRAVIVNHNASVDHDCRIGHDVHIAPGATLSGGVVVGGRCMIGAGATVIHSVRIAEDCLIGAGATVVEDIPVAGTYFGTPARRKA